MEIPRELEQKLDQALVINPKLLVAISALIKAVSVRALITLERDDVHSTPLDYHIGHITDGKDSSIAIFVSSVEESNDGPLVKLSSIAVRILTVFKSIKEQMKDSDYLAVHETMKKERPSLTWQMQEMCVLALAFENLYKSFVYGADDSKWEREFLGGGPNRFLNLPDKLREIEQEIQKGYGVENIQKYIHVATHMIMNSVVKQLLTALEVDIEYGHDDNIDMHEQSQIGMLNSAADVARAMRIMALIFRQARRPDSDESGLCIPSVPDESIDLNPLQSGEL